MHWEGEHARKKVHFKWSHWVRPPCLWSRDCCSLSLCCGIVPRLKNDTSISSTLPTTRFSCCTPKQRPSRKPTSKAVSAWADHCERSYEFPESRLLLNVTGPNMTES